MNDYAMQMEVELEAEMRAEADARLELEAERVERALEWERCRAKVKEIRVKLDTMLRRYASSTVIARWYVEELLRALDDLERLEERV